MCGINLIVDKKSSLDDSVIQRMNTALDHRGPDTNGWKQLQFNGQSMYIGNTRLQIIDQHERANQPMVSEDGQYYLTFNGEIYNHPDLRKRLIDLGHTFITESDTEVLLKWLIQFGSEGIEQLDGMFAFAFLNVSQDQLILARDRHGIKPLYYSETNSALVFSSEIKAILSSNLINKELNRNQISHYLQFRYARSPETFFRGIYSVPPGQVVEVGINQTTFKSFVSNETKTELAGNKVDAFEALLMSSVEKHLIADTRVGLFLSGGVDSTLLLALIAEQGISKIPTFSIAHSKSEGSYGTQDSIYAKRASQQYGSEHYEFEVNKSILDGLPGHLAHMDQPIGDSSSLLNDFLSKMAGEHVKCVLSGAGADEWFAGYNRHQAYYRYLSNGILNGNSRILKGVSNWLPTGIDHPLRKRFQLAKKFLSNVDSDPKTTYLNFLSFPYFREESSDISEEKDLFKWALDHDRQNYLVEDVLMLSDQWSMKNSIEMRVPYLDNGITLGLNSMDQEFLISKGKKWILKEVLNRYGGKEFSERTKEGFGLPTGKWLQDDLFQEQLSFLNDSKSVIFNYIEKEKIDHLVNSHIRKKGDFSLEFWTVMTLANWLDIHFT